MRAQILAQIVLLVIKKNGMLYFFNFYVYNIQIYTYLCLFVRLYVYVYVYVYIYNFLTLQRLAIHYLTVTMQEEG